MCPQRLVDGSVGGSEDCLYVYVYTPNGPNAAPESPVMVFLHGGGLQEGDGYHSGDYDGSELAARFGVVVVSVQYRLGALGFLALPHDQYGRGYGNFGLLDQRFALKWTRRNAASFGGDASRLLLFGESAGAISVCFHLASPRSANLFQHALMESGSCEMQVQSLSLGDQLLRSFARRASGCEWIDGNVPPQVIRDDCMQQATLDELVLTDVEASPYDAAPSFPWCQTVDNLDLFSSPLDQLRTRPANAVESITFGFNLNEFQFSCEDAYGDELAACSFADMIPKIISHAPGAETGPPYSDETTLDILHHFTGVLPRAALAPLLELYPLQNFEYSTLARLSAMLVDSSPVPGLAPLGYGGWIGACSSLEAARVVASQSPATTTVKVYNFTRRGLYATAGHFSEIPYVFQRCGEYDGACQGMPASSFTELSLSESIGAYWTTDLRRGRNDSASQTLLPWPDFSATGHVLHLDMPIETGPVPVEQQEKCSSWKNILSGITA